MFPARTRTASVLIAQALCTGAVLTVVATAAPASAATNVPCSPAALAAAITTANGSGGDLLLAPGCVYTLTTPLPAVTGTITVNARHSTLTRAATAPSFGILAVAPGGSLTLAGAVVTNGDAPDFGGGIANRGTLKVTGSTIRGNHANFSGGIGGGTGSTTTIENSAITNNTANVNGGGVANDGTMTISTSRIIGNTAVGGVGGAAANDGSLAITRSIVNENTAHRAGGVANVGGGTTTVTSTIVNANTAAVAPGGVLNTGGSVTLTTTLVRGNQPTNCAGGDVPVANCAN
ncbi:hypothetical protein [Streptomyces sp. NPDC089915]|uniref:hypothetical protein n=1 Tax=Streptomyces sp. NPDC089915 TaxID=3155186 RepID=UPI0034339222